jgi:hypothetical protein
MLEKVRAAPACPFRVKLDKTQTEHNESAFGRVATNPRWHGLVEVNGTPLESARHHTLPRSRAQ